MAFRRGFRGRGRSRSGFRPRRRSFRGSGRFRRRSSRGMIGLSRGGIRL